MVKHTYALWSAYVRDSDTKRTAGPDLFLFTTIPTQVHLGCRHWPEIEIEFVVVFKHLFFVSDVALSK